MSSIKESSLGLNYGWSYGETGWNSGMDENIVLTGFHANKQVKGILSTPPTIGVNNGDAYIVGSSPTGTWVGKYAKVAIYDRGSWLFATPSTGVSVYNKANGCWYEYNNGWSLKSEAEESPYIKVKDFDFSTGYTITDSRQLLFYPTNQTYYQWSGAFPKVVPAGSTPATSGGIGDGAWADRTDDSLRTDLNIVTKTHSTVANMVADESLSEGQKVFWLGYYEESDGGSNWGIVKSGEHTSDGGSIFSLSNGLYVEANLKGERISVKKFGAVMDGVTDDTLSIQNCIEYSAYGQVVHGGGQTSAVVCLWLKSGVRLSDIRFNSIGNSNTDMTVLNIGNDLLTEDGYHNSSSAQVAYTLSSTTGIRDIKVTNVCVDGKRADKTDFSTRDGGYYGLKIVGYVSDITVENSDFCYCGTDGVILYRGLHISDNTDAAHISNITFRNVSCLWNRRHGGAGDSIKSVYLYTCKFKNNGRTINGGQSVGDQGSTVSGVEYGNGFDMEGYGLGSYVEDVNFVDCEMIDNVRDGLLIYEPVDPTLSGFNTRKNIKIIRGVYNEGVNNINGHFCISITSSIANRALGSLYDNILIVGAVLHGSVLARAVSNLHLDTYIQDTSGTYRATLDYSLDVRDTNGISNVNRMTLSNSTGWSDFELRTSYSWSPGTIAANSQVTVSVPLSGTRYGDFVDVAFSTLNTALNAGLILTAYVVFPQDSVQVTLYNPTATSKTLTAGTLHIKSRQGRL